MWAHLFSNSVVTPGTWMFKHHSLTYTISFKAEVAARSVLRKTLGKHFDFSILSADSIWQFLPLIYDVSKLHHYVQLTLTDVFVQRIHTQLMGTKVGEWIWSVVYYHMWDVTGVKLSLQTVAPAAPLPMFPLLPGEGHWWVCCCQPCRCLVWTPQNVAFLGQK